MAQRILEFGDLGIELFMLQFQPAETEMARFARHVLPRVAAAIGASPARSPELVAAAIGTATDEV